MSRQPKSGHAAGRRLEIASCILALVVLDPDAAYPAAVRIGVERLLDRCPELGDEWVATCELMESRDAAEIGLYNVIGQVVKPALGKALGLPGDLLGSHSQPGSWQAARVAPDEDPLDLAGRIYEVVDEWAASVSRDRGRGRGNRVRRRMGRLDR
jgi:hypothetical protein